MYRSDQIEAKAEPIHRNWTRRHKYLLNKNKCAHQALHISGIQHITNNAQIRTNCKMDKKKTTKTKKHNEKNYIGERKVATTPNKSIK